MVSASRSGVLVSPYEVKLVGLLGSSLLALLLWNSGQQAPAYVATGMAIVLGVEVFI